MNAPTLHNSLTHLLEASGIKSQYPNVVCFCAYLPGEQDVISSGISALVRFRLLHPDTPVLFFSFLSIKAMQPIDEFGVLHLNSTVFIQLPYSKETLMQSAEHCIAHPQSVNSAEWKAFSENACGVLLRKKILELMHGNKFPLGNIVLNPLRIICASLLSYSNLKEDYQPLLLEKFETLHRFLAIPDVSEFIHWCSLCSHSEDTYLKNALAFSFQLKTLTSCSSQTNVEEIISLIDRVNDSFKKLQSE